MKQYFQQICYQFRTQPLLMGITVVGTALSIAFIMLYIMMKQVYITPFAPESNRDRTFYVRNVTHYRDGKDFTSGNLGEGLIRECMYPVRSAEAVAVFSPVLPYQALLPGKISCEVEVRATNEAFWKVFNFTFIQGVPYTKADVDSKLLVAVIDEGLARVLWGTTDVVGHTFELDYIAFRVVGVVRPVSSLATFSTAQVWAPFTSLGLDQSGMRGNLNAAFLAPGKSDFPAIRKEFEGLVDRFNRNLMKEFGIEVSFLGQPDEHFKAVRRKWANFEPDMPAEHRVTVLILALLLLIPAITLSSMLHSRLRMRRLEMGVRRSFGASRKKIMQEIFTESLLVTLTGAILGLLICFGACYLCGVWLFPEGQGIDLYTLVAVLFRWNIFMYVLTACVLLNLIASVFPLWRALRLSITNTMNESYE